MKKQMPKSLREAVFTRDNRRCVKCGRTDTLEVNHIVALADGGTDASENLETLCHSCHKEWHLFMEGGNGIDHGKWLSLPPCTVLVKFLLFDEMWPESVTAKTMLHLIRTVLQPYKDGDLEYELYEGPQLSMEECRQRCLDLASTLEKVLLPVASW